MGLSNKKEEQLRQMPIIKTRVTKSKDNRYLIHRTEIVSIRPMAYYEAVLGNSEDVQPELDQEIQKLTEST
mgnify:CR=1 FL=1